MNSETWGAVEWAAIIGAAAWVPHLVALGFIFLVKPRLKVILGATPEIGYTTFGPILNLNCAFTTFRKDAVIEDIELELRHERGQTDQLKWVSLNETFSQIRGPGGESQVSKSQAAIALKVHRTVLTEKLVGFQSSEFQTSQRSLIAEVLSHQSHLRKTEAAEDVPSTLEKSRPYTDLLDHHRNKFPWQEGHYHAVMRVKLLEVSEPDYKRFSFDLSKENVESLKGNITVIERIVGYGIWEKPLGDRQPDVWNWVNPQIKFEITS